jgi:hypothetical protein
VAKYEHRARTVLNLRRDETAVLCLLLLRGPQTPGELRSRSDRMYSFDGLEAVESTLARLTATAGDEAAALRPLAMVQPRQPGSREARYAHLLGGPVEAEAHALPARLAEFPGADATPERTYATRFAQLEAEVAGLRSTVAELRSEIATIGAKLDDRSHKL